YPLESADVAAVLAPTEGIVETPRMLKDAAEVAAFREAGQRLKAVAEAALAAVRPGVASSAIDAAARSVLERHGLGAAFGHGTGHGLGLEVHEEPRIARQS